MSNKNTIIQQIENAQLKEGLPAFSTGDTVVVQVYVPQTSRLGEVRGAIAPL